MKRLAEKLLGLRTEKGLDVNGLSLLAGVSAKSIERYERGGAAPRADVTRRLASALGVTAAYLMTDETDCRDYEYAIEKRVSVARAILGAKAAAGAEKLLRKNLEFFRDVKMPGAAEEHFLDALLESYMMEARKAS